MTMITRRRALQTGAAAAAVATLPGLAEAQGAPVVKLRVLETTDLHVNVFPYDYFRDAADDTVGLGRTATLIKAARAEAKNSLLFDNGDLIQGSPLGDYVAYRRGMKKGDPHPMVAAMNALDYACGTVGNHEFNYGLEFLAQFARRDEISDRLRECRHRAGRDALSPWIVLDRSFKDESRHDAADQDRRHRLRAAADRAMGQGESRRQGDDDRHRRGGAEARARPDEGRCRHRRGAVPFRYRRRRA